MNYNLEEQKEINEFARLIQDNNSLDHTFDDVEKPRHYNQGKYEVIDVIMDWGLNFAAGNVIKYIARYKYKGNKLKDLKKARYYIDKLIKELE